MSYQRTVSALISAGMLGVALAPVVLFLRPPEGSRAAVPNTHAQPMVGERGEAEGPCGSDVRCHYRWEAGALTITAPAQ